MHELLLSEDDVAGAAGSRTMDELPPSTFFCSPIADAESDFFSFSEPDGRAAREIEVEAQSGTVVVDTAVFDVRPGSRDLLFGSLRRGVDSCSGEPLSGTTGAGTVTEEISELDGLPDGAVGFSSMITGSDEVDEVARAYAMIGSRVVVVGARRTGGGQLDVPVAELMATAIAKVEAEAARQDV